MEESVVNRCLKCNFWNAETKSCGYDECEDCIHNIGECDDMCAGFECKYGNVDPKTWNPDYRRKIVEKSS
jgi:hypothetical protein